MAVPLSPRYNITADLSLTSSGVKITGTNLSTQQVVATGFLTGRKGEKGDPGTNGATTWGALSGDIANQVDLQTILNSKVPITRTVAGKPLSSDVTLNKSDVGLANVDNTSDASKPVSTATQTALDTKASITYVNTQNALDEKLANKATSLASPDNTKYPTTLAVSNALGSVTVSDATTTTKGIVQLAGDLGGTAALPTVKNVQKVFNVKDYGALGNGIELSDGAITSGSATLISASATFTPADVGKFIVVSKSGTNYLSTTIASFQSATQVTLANNATSTFTGASVCYGANDAPAIYAALLAAKAAGGGIVDYPKGIYLQTTVWSNQAVIVNNIWFRGAGRGSTVLRNGKNVTLIGIGDFTGDNNNFVYNIKISDMTFDMGNLSLNSSIQAMSLGGAQDVVIDNIHVKNAAASSGYMLGFGTNSGAGSYQFARNLLVSNSTFSDSKSGKEMVSMLQAYNCKFVNCVFRDKLLGNTLLNYGSYSFSVVNCDFENSVSTNTATLGLNGTGSSAVVGCTFFASSIEVAANNVVIDGCTFSAYGTRTSTNTNPTANAIPFFAGQIKIFAAQNGAETNWDGGAIGAVQPVKNLRIANCSFDGSASNAIRSQLFQDDDLNYYSPVTDMVIDNCTFLGSSQRGIDVAGDYVTISNCRSMNNNLTNSGSTRHNFAISGGVIKFINNTSIDDTVAQYVTYDLLIDQQATTLGVWPQTQLYLDKNHFGRQGIQIFNGAFTTTIPNNVNIFRSGNGGDKSTVYSHVDASSNMRIQAMGAVSTPTATNLSQIQDGVLVSGSTTLTSQTAVFSAADNGITVTGKSIPAGTTITFVSATQVTMSNAATGSQAIAQVTLGRTGATSRNYYVVAEDRNGNRSLVSAVGNIANTLATLSPVNAVKITWPAVPGAYKYYVLKNNTVTLLGSPSDPWMTSFLDIGQGTTGGFVAGTVGNTGNLVVDNRITASSYVGLPDATTSVKGVSLLGAATGAATFESDALKAPLASPAFTGTPTAPTAPAATNTTQLATTAYVTTAILNAASTYDDVKEYADLASFPATGVIDTIYVADDTGFLYRWSGSTYIMVGGGVPADATTSSKGVIQLAGNLGGTALAPTVLSTSLTAPLPIAQGGTGSATQNFVDLTTAQTKAGALTLSDRAVLTGGATMNATSVITDTTTGLQIGTASTQKVAFLGATPAVQQGSGIDLGAVLTAFGLRSGSGNYPISTSGAVGLSGQVTLTRSIPGSSGIGTDISITPNINQSGTAGYSAVLVNVTETTTGTGNKRLLDLQLAGTTKLNVDNNGNLNAGSNLNATSTLQSSGSLSAPVTTKTAAYTAAIGDYTILANATTAAFNVTLPTAVGIGGRIYNIKKIDSTANVVTIATTSSQTIDGATTRTLPTQYTSLTVQSDNANWFVI